MLTTLTPGWATHHSMPAMMSGSSHNPAEVHTLAPHSSAPGATPLLPAAMEPT